MGDHNKGSVCYQDKKHMLFESKQTQVVGDK